MTPVWQWSARRPQWASLLAMAAYGGGVGGLLYAGFAVGHGLDKLSLVPVVLVVLGLGWAVCRMPAKRGPAKRGPARRGPARRASAMGGPGAPDRGTLAVFSDGTWQVSLPTGTQAVHLLHAWPCFAWVALRCRAVAGAEAPAPFELVLYRSCMPADAWCALRRQVLEHTTMQRAPRIKDRP
jgi:hypothetical protein